MNLSFVLPGLHFNILETEEMLQFGGKNSRRAWHVIATQSTLTKKVQIDSVSQLYNSLEPLLFQNEKMSRLNVCHAFSITFILSFFSRISTINKYYTRSIIILYHVI